MWHGREWIAQESDGVFGVWGREWVEGDGSFAMREREWGGGDAFRARGSRVDQTKGPVPYSTVSRSMLIVSSSSTRSQVKDPSSCKVSM